MKDQMGIAWKLFPLFAATLRGRKSSRIGRAVPVNNLLHSKPTRPLFSGWWWIDRLGRRREGSALGIFTELQSANSVQLNPNGLTI